MYKSDLDYLKNELKSQNEISERLSEALSQTRDELEHSKRETINFKTKYEETVKITEENVLISLKLVYKSIKNFLEFKNYKKN